MHRRFFLGVILFISFQYISFSQSLYVEKGYKVSSFIDAGSSDLKVGLSNSSSGSVTIGFEVPVSFFSKRYKPKFNYGNACACDSAKELRLNAGLEFGEVKLNTIFNSSNAIPTFYRFEYVAFNLGTSYPFFRNRLFEFVAHVGVSVDFFTYAERRYEDQFLDLLESPFKELKDYSLNYNGGVAFTYYYSQETQFYVKYIHKRSLPLEESSLQKYVIYNNNFSLGLFIRL